MRILKKDFKHGEAVVKVEDIDDLWYLSQLIDPGDFVKGKTIRKIKLIGKDEQTKGIKKRPVYLKIKVDKVGFHEYSDVLRVSGTVEEGPEDVTKASHHTFGTGIGDTITIIKDHWLNYQIERLKEASVEKDLKILICTLDRENAGFALLKKQGYKVLSNLEGDVSKKDDAEIKESVFYTQIIRQLNDYVDRYQIKQIILASPAFWKQELLKQIKDDELKQKITLATCNAVGEEAIDEVLKRPEVKNVLSRERTTKELKLVESLLEEIAKNNLEVYGLEQTKQAAEIGAISELLVSTNFIHQKRQEGTFLEIDKIVRLVESMKGEIHIINSKNQAGKKLDGLGGIAAILRYKIS